MYKLAGWMIGGAAFAAAVLVLSRIVRRADTESVEQFRQLVARLLLSSLTPRLKVGETELIQVLSGEVRRPDIHRRIDQLVREIQLDYHRESSAMIKLKATLLYNDGDSFSAATECPWDDLPPSVREKFLRDGGARQAEIWHLPWRAGQTEG